MPCGTMFLCGGVHDISCSMCSPPPWPTNAGKSHTRFATNCSGKIVNQTAPHSSPSPTLPPFIFYFQRCEGSVMNSCFHILSRKSDLFIYVYIYTYIYIYIYLRALKCRVHMLTWFYNSFSSCSPVGSSEVDNVWSMPRWTHSWFILVGHT